MSDRISKIKLFQPRSIIIVSFFVGLLIWVFDAILDHFFFYEGSNSFIDILILDIPQHELYIRSLILIMLVLFGYLISVYESRNRKKQKQLREAQRIAKLGSWQFNLNTGTVLASKEAYKIYGLNTNEKITVKMAQAFPEPEYRPKLDKALADLIEKETPYDVKFKLRQKNTGKIIDIHSRATFDKKNNILTGTIQDITEQEELYRALIETGKRLNNAIEGTNDGLWDLNLETNEAFISERYSAMLGYEPDELPQSGEAWTKLIHPDDMDQALKTLNDYLRNKTPVYNSTFRMKTKNGTYKWINGRGKAIWDENNKPLRITGFNTDITETVNAREALKKSEQKFKNIFDSSPMGILVYDLTESGELVLADTNPAAAKLLNIDLTLKHGKTIEEAFPPLAQTDVPKIYKEIASTGITWQTEQIDYKDEQIDSAFEVHAFQTFPARMVALFLDVSEKLKTRKKLQENEEKYRLLLHNQTDLVVKVNKEGRFLFVSPSYCNMFGKTEEDLLGQTFMPLVHEEDVEHTENEMKKLYAPPHNCKIRQRAKTVHGWRWLEWVDSAILDKNGEVKEIIGVGRDIEKEKIAEEKLKQTNEEYLSANEELQEAMAQLRLKNKELQIATQKAEEANKLKSAFLANMSHEIRTPMNSILGFAQMLQRPMLPDNKVKKYVSIINQSGQRMLSTINNIMDISRIESGHYKIHQQEFELFNQVKKHYETFKPEAEAKGLKLKFTSRKSGETITTDPDKFDAILINLIKNAIKFTDEGYIEIGYKSNNSTFEFYIKDTGIGIHKDRQEAIFERFIQADIEDKEVREGTGLGLSITKAYVELLGGEISLESEPGKGTTFIFSIKNNQTS